MFIVFPIAAAVVLVFFGYIAMWSASQANNNSGVASFGRVMAIVLFVVAGFVLVAGIACGRFGCGPMPCRMGTGGMPPIMGNNAPGDKPFMQPPDGQNGHGGMNMPMGNEQGGHKPVMQQQDKTEKPVQK